MKIQTLGHATLALWDGEKTDAPLLFTDPWLTGSCYWRSWWIENYPSPNELAALKRARYCYITHEHPDHLHLPSLRLLKGGPEILVPDFLEMKMDKHLESEGHRVRRLPAGEWVVLSDNVQAMSLPLWNNDSVLLLSTPEALIINMNDAKPEKTFYAKLSALREKIAPPRCVVLRSHSPASPANSYLVDGAHLERTTKADFVRAAAAACSRIGATDFMPFASQSTFRRSDSAWANAFKVGHTDLRTHWRLKGTRLHMPYTTLNLGTGKAVVVEPGAYDPHDTPETRALIAEQEVQNAGVSIEAEDRARLQKQLNQLRPFLMALFPRGFGFRSGGTELCYAPWKGKLSEGKAENPHFTLDLPPVPFKEALAFGHLGDLCIPMFTMIHMDGRTSPKRVDMFFMLLILRDYGYLGSVRRMVRWLAWTLRERMKPLPVPSVAASGEAMRTAAE